MVQALDQSTFAAFVVDTAAKMADDHDARGDRPRAATALPEMAPMGWDEYIGQPKLKGELLIRIHSAIARGDRLPHTLLVGGGGTGKTTIARLVAHEMDLPLLVLNRPPKNNDALLDALYGYEDGILFVDEVHLWGTGPAQHALMQLTEDQQLDTSSGTVDFPNLTVIAATTDPHKLTGPLRSRFACQPQIERFTPEEMTLIVSGMIGKALVDEAAQIEGPTLVALGRASGGNPRMARRLAEATRDLAVTGMPVEIDAILSFTGISADGLTRLHVEYLRKLGGCKHGQAGLTTMATLLGVGGSEIRTLDTVLEDRGLIHYTGSQGRQITPAGRRRLAEA